MHIKESSLRRVGGGGLGSLGPLTHTGEEGPHSHGSGGTSLTRARSQEGPHSLTGELTHTGPRRNTAGNLVNKVGSLGPLNPREMTRGRSRAEVTNITQSSV